MRKILDTYSRQVLKKKGGVPMEIIALDIMEKMSWSWEQYENTPVEIIDLIIGKNEIDQKAIKFKDGSK